MKPNKKAIKITPAMRAEAKAAKEAAKAAKLAPVETSVVVAVAPIQPEAPKIVSVIIPTKAARKVRDNVTMINTADKGQKIAKSEADWNFEVEQENLKTSAGKSSGIWAVVRQDTGEVIGKYSGAKALPYKTIVNVFESGLVQAGYSFERNIITTCGGARFWADYKLAEMNVRGEGFSSMLRLQSSHNGTLKPGFCFQAKRLSCLNGMEIMETVFAMFRKHSERLDLAFLNENIHKAIEAGQGHLIGLVDAMAAISLDDNQAKNIVSNIVALGSKAGVSEKQGFFMMHNWRNPSADESGLGNNLYRLYNSATRYLRDVNNVGRFESSRKSNAFVSGAFNLAVKSEHNLARLLGAPAKPLDFDGVTINV